MRCIDQDLDPSAPTIFELVPSSLAALNVISRGLAQDRILGRNVRFVARTARTHFSGRVAGWLEIDELIANEIRVRMREIDPDFVLVALTGIDKTSHQEGHDGAYVDRAVTIVNNLVGAIRDDAEARGTWDSTHVWVVSDHGHSPVLHHEDLAGLMSRLGFKTIAHPFVYSSSGDVAVMVSGNAMAHVYLDLQRRDRPYLRDLGGKWQAVRDAILARESVDIMILPTSPHSCEIHALARGFAVLDWTDSTVTYQPATGDPLGIGAHHECSYDDAHQATVESDYPDSLVQIAKLAGSPRSGEIILSAARNWDFRARYEPIPHSSSHGALHREHMMVPLLTSHPIASRPRRTVDIMPSALDALGIDIPAGLDGRSFFRSTTAR
jgi:arylsulfatase A-like enzyme